MSIFEPKFVNRELELKALTELGKKGSPLVEFVYGPEGCGKTRLFKEFTKKFDELMDNGVIVYVDALEEKEFEEALLLSPKIVRVRSLIRTIAEGVVGPIGKLLTEEVLTILDKIAEKYSLRDKHVVIIVDDVVRAIGIDRLERYVKWLLESIYKIANKYSPRSVLIIATTSEGYSLNRVMRHRWASISLIWNLGKEGFKELSEQLNPPSNNVVEEAWKMTGGNPRALIELAIKHSWDVDSWKDYLLRKLVEVYRIVKVENVVEEVREIVDDPDNIYRKATKRMDKAYRILLDENMITYKHMRTVDGKIIRLNRELGIGEYYAWQIPVYRKVLRELIVKNSPVLDT